ncbi:MAG: helix-turn-helix transcriptional regulator [Chthoniobacterales bacterium]
MENETVPPQDPIRDKYPQGEILHLLNEVDESHLHSLRTLFRDYEVTVMVCYLWHCNSKWYIRDRKCPYDILLFPLKNPVFASFSDHRFTVKPGEFVMIPEDTTHSMDLVKGFDRSEHFVLRCHIRDQWGHSLLTRVPPKLHFLPDRDSWLSAIRQLACLMEHDRHLLQQRGEASVKELLAMLLSHGSVLLPKAAEGDPRVNAVIETMKRDFASADLSIESLVRSVRITGTQLRKLFRREIGTSPKQFLNTLRMRKAQRMLSNTDASIKEVSAACGFADAHRFHPVFLKEFGCTPAAYRRRVISEV